MSKIITAQVDYVSGHLRYGHYELALNDEEYLEYHNMSKEAQKEYIKENGTFEVDDFRINDIGEITDITIDNV